MHFVQYLVWFQVNPRSIKQANNEPFDLDNSVIVFGLRTVCEDDWYSHDNRHRYFVLIEPRIYNSDIN